MKTSTKNELTDKTTTLQEACKLVVKTTLLRILKFCSSLSQFGQKSFNSDQLFLGKHCFSITVAAHIQSLDFLMVNLFF